ncbi:MAG: heterodisulfide reductase-related iron-sulfur binding cluster, partial [Candidatus Bathyarchaeia archaeon]
MQVAVFWGCRILTSQYAYEMSVREVLPRLGAELVDLREVNCCGGIIESVNKIAASYMAARILALTGETGIKNLLLPCSRCHFMVSETQYLLAMDKNLEEKIKALLSEEKLNIPRDVKVWHTVDLLHDLIGVGKIKECVKRSLNGLRFASHMSCHAIRPSYMKRVDSSENPRKLDVLIEALGAESVQYPEKLDCCGAALMFSHPEACLSLTG